MTFKVFISSNLKDEKIIHEMKETFSNHDIETIILSEQISMGEPISEQINQLIDKSDCIIIIIGKNGDNTKTQSLLALEMGLAIGKKKVILPLVEKDVDIPILLQDKKYIIYDRDNPRLTFEKVSQALKDLKIEKDKRNLIGGIILLGLGLIILDALGSKEE